jgi:alkylated DNA repair dioxygenase AlkB
VLDKQQLGGMQLATERPVTTQPTAIQLITTQPIMQMVQETQSGEAPCWIYLPKYFLNDGAQLYNELSNTCAHYMIHLPRGDYVSKRRTCVFKDMAQADQIQPDAKARAFDYSDMPSFDWNSSPMVSAVRAHCEKMFGVRYTHCLAHIYPTGEASIGWHFDAEALDSPVTSVSFGVTRKFRFRRIGTTKGWEDEFYLQSGDVLHMLPGCQRKYQHSVPVEKTIEGVRINLTLRIFST